MGDVIGQSTTGAYSTWAQLRCPIIGAYDQFATYSGPGPQFHNLEVESGFRPDEGFFLRVIGWPSIYTWIDINSNPHSAHTGPILGFQDGGSVAPYDSFFSVGTYDANWNDTTNPLYTSVGNNLDQQDIDDALVGLTVTYSSGTFTTNSDAFENNPPYAPWFGQSIGFVSISSVSDIDTFTAF